MSPLLALLALQTTDPYVALGHALDGPDWGAAQIYYGDRMRPRSPDLDDASPRAKPPRFIPDDATPLAIQRLTVTRFEPVLAGLRRATDLAYPADPKLTADDYAAIKSLAKLVPWAAHVRFAEGDRHGAVTVLLDGLTMARRIRGSSSLGALVGVALEAIAFAGFEAHLDGIPLPECDRIRAAADAILAERIAVPADASEAFRNRADDFGRGWTEKTADPQLAAWAKERTQLRLLRLHMRVEAYRWRYGKLPRELADAAPEAETLDPVTQAPYRYEPGTVGYRLFSDGFPSQGPMGLRYRHDPNYVDPPEPTGGTGRP